MTEKSRRRPARKTRTIGAITQPPWKQILYQRPALAMLSDDEIETIHQTALTIQ